MTLERKWLKFTGGPARSEADSVRVTINRKGMFYLNTKAYETLGKPKAVAIYYSPDDDAIALEPAYERFIQNFQLRKNPHGWAIHASSFCNHFRIKVSSTQRFIRPDLTNEGQLILNLRETVAVGGMVRKRKRETN